MCIIILSGLKVDTCCIRGWKRRLLFVLKCIFSSVTGSCRLPHSAHRHSLLLLAVRRRAKQANRRTHTYPSEVDESTQWSVLHAVVAARLHWLQLIFCWQWIVKPPCAPFQSYMHVVTRKHDCSLSIGTQQSLAIFIVRFSSCSLGCYYLPHGCCTVNLPCYIWFKQEPWDL